MSLDELPLANELLHVLDVTIEVLNENGVRYALIGGLAVAMRGTIRATRDVDLLLTVAQVDLPRLLDGFRSRGCQIDPKRAIENWNRDHMLQLSLGQVRIDWLKAVLPTFERILERSKTERIGDRPLKVADAEGVILLKLIAFRQRDQEDIRSILAANAGRLDLDWIRREWLQLADAEDPRAVEFEKLVVESNAG